MVIRKNEFMYMFVCVLLLLPVVQLQTENNQINPNNRKHRKSTFVLARAGDTAAVTDQLFSIWMCVCVISLHHAKLNGFAYSILSVKYSRWNSIDCF